MPLVGETALSRVQLKSHEFRREREASWRELEELVARTERGGGGTRWLSSEELLRLPVLYRAAVSSLSVARSISLDRNVVEYLESLAARAFFVVYGTRATVTGGVVEFFARQFPAAIRAARWHLLVAALALALGAVTAFVLVSDQPEWFYTFVPAELAAGRTPAVTTASLEEAVFSSGETRRERIAAFAAFLFTHNAKIGMLAFALGFAFGIPTILLLIYNGLTLGSFIALHASRGLGFEFGGWIFVHGTTEVLAVLFCGAAGLQLGSALTFPGRHGRLEVLARAGRRSGRIVIGSVAVFLVAALLEGFVRDTLTDTALRYEIGATALVLWSLYFLLAGRTRPEARHDG